MFYRLTIFTLTLLFLFLSILVPAARAQKKCTLETMTGTYAFYEKGASSYVDATGTLLSPPATPPFWNSVEAPFATVGEVTFGSNGVGKGFYWISIGFATPTTEPIPVTVTITEMNPDCSGLLSYPVPGNPPAIIVERFIAFDDGREFRSVPATITNGVPGLAWIGEGHRIGKSDETPKFCGPKNAQGTFLLAATAVVAFDGVTGYADSWLLRQQVSRSGDFQGTLYEKLGMIPEHIKDPVCGQIVVNPDCSFSETINIPAIGGAVHIRGVFFDDGNQFYAMSNDGFPILYSIGQGKRLEERADRERINRQDGSDAAGPDQP